VAGEQPTLSFTTYAAKTVAAIIANKLISAAIAALTNSIFELIPI
jgi:hypothetical protein